MIPVENEYIKGFEAGYAAAVDKYLTPKEEKPVYDYRDIMERYGIGENKARSLLIQIRRACNGGMIGSASVVKRSELLYWETLVDKGVRE